MCIHIQNKMNSSAIYRYGYNNPNNSEDPEKTHRINAKEFFNNLSKSIIDEYEHQGFCDLVDDVIGGREPLDFVAYAAMLYAREHFMGNPLDESEQYIPYAIYKDFQGVSHRLMSEDYDKVRMNANTTTYEMYIIQLLDLRNAGKRAHLESINITEQHPDVSGPIIEEANQQANQIIAEAQKNADRIYSAAEQYLKEERLSFKKEINKEISIMLKDRDDQIGLMDKKHNEMRDATDSLHAVWSEELTQTIENLSGLKNELYDHIHNWQISLYHYEIEPLAQRYIELYKIINVDRMIDAEVLFACSNACSKDETRVNPEVSNLDSNEQKENVKDKNEENVNCDELDDNNVLKNKETLDALQKLNKTLNIFLRQFEVSLNGLGMYVFYPKEGDEFDDVWHILDNEENINDSIVDSIIKRCVLPGVAKRINAEEDEVIIPAVVEI